MQTGPSVFELLQNGMSQQLLAAELTALTKPDFAQPTVQGDVTVADRRPS